MRQVNFVVLFVICFGLVFFAVQNPEPTVIHLFRTVQFKAPLSIELLVAMGLGAVVAWFFSLWTGAQRSLEVWLEMRRKNQQIRTLEQDIERVKSELEAQQRQPLLSSAQNLADSTEPDITDAELIS